MTWCRSECCLPSGLDFGAAGGSVVCYCLSIFCNLEGGQLGMVDAHTRRVEQIYVLKLKCLFYIPLLPSCTCTHIHTRKTHAHTPRREALIQSYPSHPSVDQRKGTTVAVQAKCTTPSLTVKFLANLRSGITCGCSLTLFTSPL